jgi:hypothetical protein
MPRETRFGVFEMGMNHAGELAALTRLVRPHVAIVTAIAPAHREYFASEEAIADAKGEIFQGLEEGGTALVPFDSPHRDRLVRAARPYAATILTFGLGEGADIRARDVVPAPGGGSLVTALLPGAELTFTVSQPGEHWVSNALAVLGAVEAMGGDLAAGLALADLPGLKGRGERRRIALDGGEALLIDESYNANPASMAATSRPSGRSASPAGGSPCSARCASLANARLPSTPRSRRAAGGGGSRLARSSSAKRWNRWRKPLAQRSKWRMCRTRRRRSSLRGPRPGRATRSSSRDPIRSDWPPSSRRWRAGKADDFVDCRAAGLPRGVQPLPLHHLPRRRGDRDRALHRPDHRPEVHRLAQGPPGQGQPIRVDGPETHLAKRGTPTMGGLMILTSLTVSMLLWMDFANTFLWACLFITVGFGLIGFLDDYDKVTKRSHKGISGESGCSPSSSSPASAARSSPGGPGPSSTSPSTTGRWSTSASSTSPSPPSSSSPSAMRST